MAWTWERTWAAVRDVASWGLGAWGFIGIRADPTPADPLEVAIVAALLGLPFVFRADELRRRDGGPDPPSTNGQGPDAPSSERASL